MIKLLNQISKEYEIISFSSAPNSSNGICLLGSKKYFYKILPTLSAYEELQSYSLAVQYLPCVALVRLIECGGFSALIYDYEEVIGYNKGLLYDWLSDSTIPLIDFSSKFDEIIRMYTKTFDNPVDHIHSKAYDCFILSRITSRLINWYSSSQDIIVIRGRCKSFSQLCKEIGSYLQAYFPTAFVLSHGDPSDMNITVSPCFLDYATFGLNPICLEFVSFFWNLSFGGAYFFPKYFRHQYALHQYLLPVKEWKVENTVIRKIYISTKRVIAIKSLVNSFRPFLQIEAKEIVYMLIFRMITIINLNTMDNLDRMFIFTLVEKLIAMLDEEKHVLDSLITLVEENKDDI